MNSVNLFDTDSAPIHWMLNEFS